MKLRNEIITKSREESQKNVNIFYEDIKKITTTNTHVMAWVRGRFYGGADNTDSLQKVQLINGDMFKSFSNKIEKYGVIILATAPGRYTEAVGILVRKDYYSSETNECVEMMPSIG